MSHLFILAEQMPATPQQPSLLVQLFPLILIFIMFYFLLIRPQQKRQREHEKLVAGLKTGDRVVTSAGIHGIITNVKDRTVTIKVADNVRIEFDRNAVVQVEKTAETPTSS